MADNRFNQGVAEGLTGQGLTQLGSIAAIGQRPQIQAAVVGAAQETAVRAVQAMRTRYWQEEYKQFSQAYIEPAKEQMELIASQFEMETKVANRVIAFPRSQAQVQEDANTARRAAPGPETDAKADGPAGLLSDGDGGFEYDERPAMFNLESGQPIQMGTMEATEYIRAAMGKAMSANNAITMKLMDAFAEFPNNPLVQQAGGKMFENLQQQLAFASTGKSDAMEAGRYMDEREAHEADVQETAANTAATRQMTGARAGKEQGELAAAVTRAAALIDAGFGEYFSEKMKQKLAEDLDALTYEDTLELRASNNVAGPLYDKQVAAGLAAQKASQFMKSASHIDSASFPAQIRASKPYQNFLAQAMQPVMTDYIQAWNNNSMISKEDGSAQSYRESIGAPEHLLLEDTSDNRVTDFLMQHAAATHPNIEARASEQTWDYAYQTDKPFADRVESDMAEEIRKRSTDGMWNSGHAALYAADPTGFARAFSLHKKYKPQPGTKAATIWRNMEVEAGIEQSPLEPYMYGPPEGGHGMLMSHQAPATIPLKAPTPKAVGKPAGPAHEWLKSKIGTGHPASQETNTPRPKKAVVPATKHTQPTDTKAKTAKKGDKSAAKESQPTDSKKGAKASSPRLQVKKGRGTTIFGGGKEGGLAAPPKVEIPKAKPPTWGKVEIDPSRLRKAVAIPTQVKSLEDFIKDINANIGDWYKGHKEKEKNYKSRYDTGGK